MGARGAGHVPVVGTRAAAGETAPPVRNDYVLGRRSDPKTTKPVPIKASVAGSGAWGGIANENSTYSISLKLSVPGVTISTDFRVSPSVDTMPGRSKSASGPLTPVKAIVPGVPRPAVQMTFTAPVNPLGSRPRNEKSLSRNPPGYRRSLPIDSNRRPDKVSAHRGGKRCDILVGGVDEEFRPGGAFGYPATRIHYEGCTRGSGHRNHPRKRDAGESQSDNNLSHLKIDPCPGAMRYGIDATGVTDQERPCVLACRNDCFVAVPDALTELVAAQVVLL